ncbi:MAG TPA: hypothetical protein VHB21_15125, partial [Minicystis sp.]|nr:hypothetical protein [Minicystis sp.]
VLLSVAPACAKGATGGFGVGGSGGSPTSGPGPGPASGSGGGASSSSGSGVVSSSASSSGASSASASASSSSSGSGGATCGGTHLVIGEIKTRGTAGGSDEFVELYNPTASAVTLDGSWSLTARAVGGASYTARWAGGGANQLTAAIPAHGHYLIAGTAYAGGPSADDALSSGIKDAASVVLEHAGSTVDAICFGYAGANAFDASYTCEGAPADNGPHDDSASAQSDVDVSLERRPGDPNDCTDTDDNASDFVSTSPSTPKNAAGG